jgi:shikimate kinase
MASDVRARTGTTDNAAGGSDETPAAWTRVVLVGFMGSGKTTVGRLLARRLGWSFVDLDDEVEAASGGTVEELFREHGEATFREIEGRVGADALARSNTVLAPGGGWSLSPGRLDHLPPGSLSVWLIVTPDTAVRRATGRGRVRPLLGCDDPVARARALLSEREPVYARAHLHLDTEGATPDSLADRIAKHLERGR